MSAQAQRRAADVPHEDKRDDVLIHVRFAPNAEVFTIDQLPPGLTGREWFERLTKAASQHYATFAGGRGFFRIPRSTFEGIPQVK
jgi:hypothetical protein